MKFSLKTMLIALFLLNMYFFSFFIWYRPVIFTCRFIDSYERLPDAGPAPISVFVPRLEHSRDKPAGIVSRIISYSYTPLTYFWEKRGIGIFCVNESLEKLKESVDEQ